MAVFKYENAPPVHHNVYLFKDFAHYQACDFSEATLLANSTQGTAPGFEYKLPERGWYHFGCSVPAHCTEGLMKFITANLQSDHAGKKQCMDYAYKTKSSNQNSQKLLKTHNWLLSDTLLCSRVLCISCGGLA